MRGGSDQPKNPGSRWSARWSGDGDQVAGSHLRDPHGVPATGDIGEGRKGKDD